MKKIFLRIDFWIQTLLLLLVPLSLIVKRERAGIPLLILVGLIGIWQFSTSIIHSFLSGFSIRKNYLILSILTIITFYIGMTKNYSLFDSELVLLFPALIAIWYYKITLDEFYRLKSLLNSSEN